MNNGNSRLFTQHLMLIAEYMFVEWNGRWNCLEYLNFYFYFFVSFSIIILSPLIDLSPLLRDFLWQNQRHKWESSGETLGIFVLRWALGSTCFMPFISETRPWGPGALTRATQWATGQRHQGVGARGPTELTAVPSTSYVILWTPALSEPHFLGCTMGIITAPILAFWCSLNR